MSEYGLNNNDPPLAEIVEETTGNSKKFSCLGCAAVMAVFLVVVFVCGAYFVYRQVSPENIVTVEEAREQLDQRCRLARAAFSSDELLEENDNKELKELRKLFQKVSEIASYEIKPELSQIIDFSRYASAMREDEGLGGTAFFGNAVNKVIAEQNVLGPAPFDDCQIYQVDDLGGDERLVYVQTTGEYGDDAPFLFWVIKNQNDWRLYDWENLRYGIKDSQEVALIVGDKNFALRVEHEKYTDLYGQYSQWSESEEPNAQGKVRAILKKSENLNFIGRLHDPYIYDIATRFYYNSNNQLALTALKKLKDEDSVPGVNFLRGLIFYEEDEYQKAIAAFDKYHSKIGFDSESLDYLAYCYDEINEDEKALSTRFKALRDSAGEHYSTLTRIIAARGTRAIDEIVIDPYLKNSSLQHFPTIANVFSDRPIFEPELKAILDAVAKANPDSADYHRVAGSMEFLLGNYKTGLQHLLKANGDNPDQRYSLLYKASMGDQLFDVFFNSPEPESDFYHITELYDDEGAISDVEMKKIVELFMQRVPDSELGNLWLGYLAMEKGDYLQAIEYLEKRMAATSKDPSEDESQLNRTRELLAQSLFKNGQHAKALEMAESDTSTLQLFYADAVADLGDERVIAEIIDSLDDSTESQLLKGENLIRLGQFSEASDLLTEVVNKRIEEGAAEWSIRAAANKLIEANRRLGDLNDTFSQCRHPEVLKALVYNLVADCNWERAKELIKQVESKLENEAAGWTRGQRDVLKTHVSYLKIWMNYQAGNFEIVTGCFEDYLSAATRCEQIDRSTLLVCVRSALLSSGRELAQEMIEGKDDSEIWDPAKALVALASKDFEAYQRINQRLYYSEENPHYLATEIDLSDEEIKAASDPLPLMYRYSVNSDALVSLGYSAKPDISTDKLKEWAKSQDLEVWQTNSKDEMTDAWMLRNGSISIAISLTNAELKTSHLAQSKAKVFDKQKYRISIYGYNLRSASRVDRVRQLTYQLANHLGNDDTVLLYVEDFSGDWQQSREGFAQMANGEILRSQLFQEMNLEFPSQPSYPAGDEETDENAVRVSSQLKLARLAKPFIVYLGDDDQQNEDPEYRLQLKCAFQIWPAREEVLVEVDSVVREDGYSVQYIGRLITSSRLFPEFEKGTRVKVPSYNIAGWQQVDKQGKVVEQGDW